MSNLETNTELLQNLSPIRTKLFKRINDPLSELKFVGDEKEQCKNVLEKLPEDVVGLLDEDSIIETAVKGVDESLKGALLRFANNNMAIHQNDKHIILSGDQFPPSSTIMANVALRGDCTFMQGDQQNWWTLKIPRRISPDLTVPTVYLPKPPFP